MIFTVKLKRGAAAVFAGTLLVSAIGVSAQDFTITKEDIRINEAQAELLPLRYAAENSGYTVDWNGGDNTVTLKNGKHTVRIRINERLYDVDGKPATLKDAPLLIDDKTYISDSFANDIFPDKYITKTDSGYSFADKTETSADNMMKTIREISGYPRSVDDATHLDAMNYVTDKLTEYGYEPQKQSFEFDYMDFSNETTKTVNGTNIVAVKPADLTPNGDILIIGAHYDGEKGFPAANDNGSGLSVLLELARVLKNLPSDTEIRFVAFDAEETGLNGSKAYVKTLKDEQENIVGMINFDMLGAAKAKEFGVYTAEDKTNYLTDILKACPDFDEVAFRRQMFGMSDHMSFSPLVIPNLTFTHEAIAGEYHCENDIADNINPDRLKAAADSGYFIASTVMSNLSGSYKAERNPILSDKTIDITAETVIPTADKVDSVSKRLGVKLTQIPSDDNDPKYIVNIKLFDYDKPLKMVYRGQLGADFAANPYIDISSEKYEDIRAVLERNLTENLNKGNEWTNYFYNTLYGVCYNLHYDEKTNEASLNVTGYRDTDEEAYAIKNGELIKLDDSELYITYSITKENAKIKVNEKKPKPTGEAASDKAKKCWDRLKPYLSELGDIDYLMLSADGIGGSTIQKYTEDGAYATEVLLDGEVPEEFKYLPEKLQPAVTRAARRIEEGQTFNIYSDPVLGTKLYVDYLDLLNEQGDCFTEKGLLKSIAEVKIREIIGYGKAGKVYDENAVKPENPTAFEENTWNLNKNGYLYKFVEKFYKNIYADTDWESKDLYTERPDEFVSIEAAQSREIDLQSSFVAFVTEDKPLGNSIAEQKIRFFYDFPELVQIRENLRKNIK